MTKVASLSKEELERWDREHRELLDRIAPDQFEVLHFAALSMIRSLPGFVNITHMFILQHFISSSFFDNCLYQEVKF